MKKSAFLLAMFIAILMFAGCTHSDEETPELDSELDEFSEDGTDSSSDGSNTPVNDADTQKTGDSDADTQETGDSGADDHETDDPDIQNSGDSDGLEQPDIDSDTDSDTDSGSGSNGGQSDQGIPLACASVGSSYLGCDFYTAKLYNGRKTEKITSKDSFSVAIANSHPTETATIEFFKTLEDGSETKIESFEYCYKVTKSFLGIEYDDMECKNHDSSFVITVNPQETILVTPKKEDRMLIGTAASFLSYHIKSDFPVIVYQFNPFYNLSSNDASLVFPTNTLGIEYFVASYQDETNVGSDGPAYFTIIGVNDTTVELEITPTANIAASGKIPGTAKGVPMTVEITKGEVLNIVTTSGGDDFTGTKISCKNPGSKCAPFAVFGGHGCADIPKDKGYCDHLEHQLLPVNRWGTRYAVVKTTPRRYARDFVRVTAAADGTNVSIKIRDEKSKNGSEQKITLNAGDFREYELNHIDENGYSYFTSGTSFIEADKPVQITQYLSGSADIDNECGSTSDLPGTSHSGCHGDPAMTIIPPVEQFKNEYYFFSYSVKGDDDSNENYVEVITDPGVEITLDDKTPTPAKDGEMQGSVYGSEKVFYIFELDTEFMQHHLKCSSACGILVYGWGMDVSYMYPGGLDMKIIDKF